ncbi:OsmC family peroxiredoxin [Pseudonocardiaceae bacterium YIM PH 21723]|nr:OsmC family peroxiredoxin [Pseudonocardiaceae bacterium YIM PH 21723]
MGRKHGYTLTVEWTGNQGTGTSGYKDYTRAHDVRADGKPLLQGSADPAFFGDASRWNPEELLVISVSQCHMLTFLWLAQRAGIIVTEYVDEATGTMEEDGKGGGQFTEITLRPRAVITDPARIEQANSLHAEVHKYCFIARSINFPIHHEPVATAT